MTTGTQVKLVRGRDWEVCEVGTKFVDGGLDFLDFGRGRRFRIKGIGIRLSI
jgi:hypothetical protein